MEVKDFNLPVGLFPIVHGLVHGRDRPLAGGLRDTPLRGLRSGLMRQHSGLMCLAWGFFATFIRGGEEIPAQDEITPLGRDRYTWGVVLAVICFLTPFPNGGGVYSSSFLSKPFFQGGGI
ncbi:hypothetical protein ACP4OV_002921 [Aristida adscensionis]